MSIKKYVPWHYHFVGLYKKWTLKEKIFLLALEDDAIELPRILRLMLREFVYVWVVSPLVFLKEEARKKFSIYFGNNIDVAGFDVENIIEKKNDFFLQISTFGSLIADELVTGKARAKVFERFGQKGMFLRAMSYDKHKRMLHLQFFTKDEFKDKQILDLVHKVDFAFTDLDVKNSLSLYPMFENYKLIDREGDDVYTVKLTYKLPSGLSEQQLTFQKLKSISSYLRLPLYEHKIKSHQEYLELYIELNPRPLHLLKYTDFPPADGIRVVMWFDLKYRKPIYMNFSQQTVEQWDYGFAPHYIVAGATGSGKSVFIKFFILQLLRSNMPEDLRLFLVDPKVVSFNIFKNIPHLYAPIISDAKKFKLVLEWIVQEVERRYKILAKYGVENNIDLKKKYPDVWKDMPYIMVIVDEFADVVDSQDRKTKEEIIMLIKRLGQKARAAGVHLILITQRATSTNIDSEIKANMAWRIAFRVASEWDSHILIEESVAADIESPGEWYAKIGDADELVHFQAPFVDDDDIKKELERFSDIPLEYMDKYLSHELLKEPLSMKEVKLDILPKSMFPHINIGVDLKSHNIISLSFARDVQIQEDEPTPHMIIAWATNSGKSRFAKLLVNQLAHSGSPELLRLVLIDPKIVTFSVFKWLPHLLCPVITKHEELLPKLEEILETIKKRYEIFAEARVENIDAYRKETGKKMYSIVIIMDEFADLLDAYDYKWRDAIEKILKRFGQMARAAWVHLVLITQRATAQNIPWEVRTHFAWRLAFRMNSEADSFYILEEGGAEKLQSAGLFLFKQANAEIVQWYAPLIHNNDLAEMLAKMKEKYII